MNELQREKRDWQGEQRGLREAFGLIGMIRLWLDQNPQMALQMAIELNQLLKRYTDDPTPDLEMRVKIPLSIWRQWIECRDVERAEILLVEAMTAEIEKRQKGYIPLKTDMPLSMYEEFEKACATLEGKEIEEEHLPAYVQSVLCKAIQDFIKQHGR